jgi:hypothetical protein
MLPEVAHFFKYHLLMTTATKQPEPELLTLRELAEYLRVSERTAYQLVSDGTVPATKVTSPQRPSPTQAARI